MVDQKQAPRSRDPGSGDGVQQKTWLVVVYFDYRGVISCSGFTKDLLICQ